MALFKEVINAGINPCHRSCRSIISSLTIHLRRYPIVNNLSHFLNSSRSLNNIRQMDAKVNKMQHLVSYHMKHNNDLPTNNVTPEFPVVRMMPTGIFRSTKGEVLGNGAAKEAIYKNPEYFSYHQMSYYDIQLHLRKMVKPNKLVTLTSLGIISVTAIFECRKYSHNLPENNIRPCFQIVPNLPSGIFRCTEGEILGLGAGKNCCYQAPEYFSFHQMSYYDIPFLLSKNRLPPPDPKRKPP